MTDWISELCRSYAKRLRQEVKLTDTMEELIRRECDIADELAVIVIQMEDEIIHTDEHPFCDDPSCGCHHDIDLLKEQVFEPFFNGLLTAPEAHRFMEGKQL